MNKKPINICGRDYILNVGNYPATPVAMYLELVEADTKEPYCVATVNLGKSYTNYLPNEDDILGPTDSFIQLNTSFLNTNMIPDTFLKEIMEKLDGKFYTRYGQEVVMSTGFVDYPLVSFSPDKLKEYDKEGYDNYEKNWWTSVQKEQKMMNEAMFGNYGDDDIDLDDV